MIDSKDASFALLCSQITVSDGNNPVCAAATKLLQSCLTLCGPVDCSRQVPLSMGILPWQEYWCGLPSPLPAVFPTQGSHPSLLYSLGYLEVL